LIWIQIHPEHQILLNRHVSKGNGKLLRVYAKKTSSTRPFGIGIKTVDPIYL